MFVRRGDLFWADLSPTKGSEQTGRRPVLIIQNDIGNERSATTIIAPVTTHAFSREFPTNVFLSKNTTGLKSDSDAMLFLVETRLENRLNSPIIFS